MSNIVIGKKIAKFRVEKPGEAEAKKAEAAPVVTLRQDPVSNVIWMHEKWQGGSQECGEIRFQTTSRTESVR